MQRNLIGLLLLIPLYSLSNAQVQQKPEIGKLCPEFRLNHVTHYPLKQVTLKDFKGKWLFLDFWSQTCTSCLKGFPKVNQLQSEFIANVQFLLVGKNDKKYNRNIEEVFEKIGKKQGWNIASAYDSVLISNWDISSIPHIVIIDPNGIVRYVTDGRDMNKAKIQALLAGKPVNFYPKDSIEKTSNGNAIINEISNFSKDKILYNSLITRWNGEPQNGGYEIDRFIKVPAREKGYQLAAVHLLWIYNTAYFGRYYFKILGDSLYGKIWQVPILEVRDSLVFEYDFTQLKGLYNYSLLIPLNQITKANIMRYMQEDLERTFGYKAFIEERYMPIWKLVAKPGIEEKIRTKGDNCIKPWDNGGIAAGFIVKNVSMEIFLSGLINNIYEKEDAPFIDATGIRSNIDFTIDADMTDISDIKRELKKQGLDLVKGTKKMKVLVIRDPKN